MAAQTLIYVTGFAQLDAKLRAMPAAMQRKLVRGGLRKAAKRDEREFKRIVHTEAHDTGALEKSTKIRAMKRSRVKAGVSVLIDRDKLFANYAAKHEGKQPHPAAGEKDPFYYPSVIEFGDETHEPVRPMRRALYDNADVYRAYFEADVTQFINEQKVSTVLPKATGYTGKKL